MAGLRDDVSADSVMAGGDSGVGTGSGQEWQWDVVLAFVGAQRGYVEQVAETLKARGGALFLRR
jgi:hypothetical protein